LKPTSSNEFKNQKKIPRKLQQKGKRSNFIYILVVEGIETSDFGEKYVPVNKNFVNYGKKMKKKCDGREPN